MPRQKTAEHVSPPPIEEGEIEIFRSQISDLASCSENKTLFDFLISDIDRNRLTQIALILADRGDFAIMAQVIELTETLDRLIGTRIEENHHTDIVSLNRTLDQVLMDADQVVQDPSISTESLRGKVKEFDAHFYSHQDAPFDKVLLLTQMIEEMRHRIREGTTSQSPDATSPALDERWVAFPPHPASPDLPKAVVPADICDSAPDDDIMSTQSPACESGVSRRFFQAVFSKWKHASSIAIKSDRLKVSNHASRLSKLVSEWRFLTLFARTDRQRSCSLASFSIRSWLAHSNRMQKVACDLALRDYHRLLGPTLSAWRSRTIQVTNNVFALSTCHEETWAITVLYEWRLRSQHSSHLNSAKLSQELSIKRSRVQGVFIAWQNLEKVFDLMRVAQMTFYRRCMQQWNAHVIKTRQVRNRVDSLKKAYAILAEWRAKTRNVHRESEPVYDADAWEADEEIAHNPLEESSMSIPCTAECFVIQDKPSGIPTPCELSVIKQQTEKIITQTQVFISQHRTVNHSPAGNFKLPPASVPRTTSAEPSDFFRAFELKWRDEQAKWKL